MSRPDMNYRSVADVDGYLLHDEIIDPSLDDRNPLEFDDVLKFSHARNVRASRLYVAGGRENAIDLNRRCANVVIEDSVLEGGRQAAVVIKGESHGTVLRRVALLNCRGWCDILIGDWSDQALGKTTGTVLEEVSRRDGKPVRVVVGRADWPEVRGGKVKVCRGLSYGLKLYWWAKYVWTLGGTR